MVPFDDTQPLDLNDPNQVAQAQQQVQTLADYRVTLINQERNLKAREQALSEYSSLKSGPNLRDHFQSFLPPHLVPGNVGPINAVTWGFWQEVTFDFGANPTITANSRQTQSFQVTQEAAFLLLAVSRNANSDTESGALGPWQIEIRDRQSTRQLNDRPIPLQALGFRSNPSILPTPYLIMPNAFIDVIMSSWRTTGSQITAGSGRHQIAFFGYRVRIEDAGTILSTIFS